ncbi:unnamed protein product [Adineta ricciae]|uniref:Uncharacterized protein n=1 Tax=Adineta ricciae TaxID=249248 RepID=A0A814I1Z2_ADIRI|nr:unnamed protein product [Adineta ricciae]
MMITNPTTSNLAEALLNIRKIEDNFYKREFQFLDRDRNKIRSHFDRHKDAFLQLTRQRHETWYRHDKHFREGLRKEKDNHEKRKRNFVLTSDPDYTSKDYRPLEIIDADGSVLPPINASTTTKTRKKAEPMTKVERDIYHVLRASQKLLNESAARPRYKFILERPSSTSISKKVRQRPTESDTTAQIILPTLKDVSSDYEEYDRLVNKSLQGETFSEFVDHIVKFRPEFCEQFGSIYEENKRQKAIEKLRELNQIHARNRDGRYHNLLSSLTDSDSPPN